GLGFNFDYIYRRSSGADILDSLPIKAQVGALGGTGVVNYLKTDLALGAGVTHETCDPVFKECRMAIGYLRIPAEYYYPYIHTIGVSLDYAEDVYTQAVYNLDVAYRRNVPIGTASPKGNGLKSKDVLSSS